MTKYKLVKFTENEINFLSRVFHDADANHDWHWTESRFRDNIKRKLGLL
jgi:hypothetical protein